MPIPRFASDPKFWVSLVVVTILKMILSNDPKHQTQMENFVASLLWSIVMCIFFYWFNRKFIRPMKDK